MRKRNRKNGYKPQRSNISTSSSSSHVDLAGVDGLGYDRISAFQSHAHELLSSHSRAILELRDKLSEISILTIAKMQEEVRGLDGASTSDAGQTWPSILSRAASPSSLPAPSACGTSSGMATPKSWNPRELDRLRLELESCRQELSRAQAQIFSLEQERDRALAEVQERFQEIAKLTFTLESVSPATPTEGSPTGSPKYAVDRAVGLTRAVRKMQRSVLASVFGKAPSRRKKNKELAALVEVVNASPYFDRKWYLVTYTDVAASGMDPAVHYIKFGAAEGRDPGPLFSTKQFFLEHPEAQQGNVNPLVHIAKSRAIAEEA